MRAGRYARICVCLQRSTKYLFAWCLKASLHNKVGIVTAQDNLVKLPDLQSSMVWWNLQFTSWWAAKRCMTIWKSTYWCKECTYSRKIYRRFWKRTRYEHKRVHGKDNSIMITALPKMTKPLLPLDKYGQPLNYLNPNTTNNHEQQIYA
jgi:hypothetical protein